MDAWSEFKKYFYRDDAVGISIDFSGAGLTDVFLDAMGARILAAHGEMDALEGGAIANGNEGRMVGHYWLRSPQIAPSAEIQRAIGDGIGKIKDFARLVHLGKIAGQGGRFEHALFIGIGGSALGPQLLDSSLPANGKIDCHFIDNTDPDGMDIVLGRLAGKLGQTLVVVTSKSGSTPEPRNAMVEVMAAYADAGHSFRRHAVCITGQGSLLGKQATEEGWIGQFPMWDWVGGRTSIFSAVGLLPLALRTGSTDPSQNPVENFMAGARAMDAATRVHGPSNPAMLLALAWYRSTEGGGKRAMVVIPYKDRLANFSKYLQQLIMESLGKKNDRSGNEVRHGLTVYGNRGSTDQHSFVQQLRDGPDDFFLTTIGVLEARNGNSIAVDPDGMTSGDYLHGFALGTMEALADRGTAVLHITVDRLSEYELGALIALYERAVGFYASLVNVNAYDQPGVEAGKKAAAEILELQRSVVTFLRKNAGDFFTADAIASALGLSGRDVLVFKLLEHLAMNNRSIEKIPSVGGNATAATYGMVSER
jgi:glucose-6-phosphate isomerase